MYKYTDKNHPPVPLLKVGDICYAHCQWGIGHQYSEISKCEIRKVEVKWYEPSEYDKKRGDYGFWHIDYYIRSDINMVGLKSTKMFPFHTSEDGSPLVSLFFTPQEVMDENIRDFKKMLENNICQMRQQMQSLGYTEEQTTKLLEYEQRRTITELP